MTPAERRLARLAAVALTLAGLAGTAAVLLGWPPVSAPALSPASDSSAAFPLAVALGVAVLQSLRPRVA